MNTDCSTPQNCITVQNADGNKETQAQIILKNDMPFTPVVSVIMPVFNAAQFLDQCLDSIRRQTLGKIEIICIDDGSEDSSLQILTEHAHQDKRIMILKQQNMGAGTARNAGITVASGKYLSFLDSDDFFEPNMLETAVSAAEKLKCDVLIFNSFNFDQATQTDEHSYLYQEKYIEESPWHPARFADRLYFIAPPAPWNKLFHRDLIINKQIRFENFKSCNDITFVNTALSVARKIGVINNHLVHYRRNSGTNISAHRERHAVNIIYAFQKLQTNLEKHGVFNTFQNIFYKQLQARANGESQKCQEPAKTEFLNLLHQTFPDMAQHLNQQPTKHGIIKTLFRKIFHTKNK